MSAQDLRFMLLAAISAREERARAATVGPWFASSGYPQIVGSRAVAERMVDESTPEADVWLISTTLTHRPDEDAALIAAEDPAAVLRQTTRDRRVLARHEPDGETLCWHTGGAIEFWPCDEIRDMADAYAIPPARHPLPEESPWATE